MLKRIDGHYLHEQYDIVRLLNQKNSKVKIFLTRNNSTLNDFLQNMLKDPVLVCRDSHQS